MELRFHPSICKSMRYFKKTSPKTKVYLACGQYLQFENIDHEWGVYPPEGRGISPMLISEIEDAIRSGRGGIEEIQAQEYNAFIQKKNKGPLPKLWREEVGKSVLPSTESPSAALPKPAAEQVVAAAKVLQAPASPAPPSVPERPTASKRPST